MNKTKMLTLRMTEAEFVEFKYIMNEAVYGHYFSRAEAAFIWAHCCRHHESNPWDWIDEMADTIHEYKLIMENEK